MLNELHDLAEALRQTHLITQQWHREFKPLPKVTRKSPCLRIWLDDEGSVSSIDRIEAELAAKLRKYGNNLGTFPAFNMAPLYRLSDPAIIKEFDQLMKRPEALGIARIKNWCTEDNRQAHSVKHLKRCIDGCAEELGSAISVSTSGQQNSMTALLQALKKLPGNRAEEFWRSLEACIFSKLNSGQDVQAALALLFHKSDLEKPPDKDDSKLSIILDYSGWRDYGHPVASEAMTKWINGVLLEWETSKAKEGEAGAQLDAFGSPLGNIRGEPLPQVDLPGFRVILRSMFKDVRCQWRYHLAGDHSFPIARENRKSAKAALEYLAKPENRFKTWKKIPDKKEIVFAYPSKLPANASAMDWLAPVGRDASDDEKQGRFEQCAANFIRAFSGLLPEYRPDNIRIFSLRNMDKARTKVIFTRNMLPNDYIDCAKRWQKGCANIPEFHFVKPLTPFPLEVAELCNTVWKRNGEPATTGKSTLGRVQLHQGMELLLDNISVSELLYFLRLTLQNCLGLFIFFANQWPRDKAVRPSGKATRGLSMLIPLLGLFLDKGGHEKEEYMESSGYLVGQLLKLSDELHAMYCHVVRNGDAPPQLLGNSVFVTASETPVKALALLGQRIPPYLAWAQRYSHQKADREQGSRWENWRAGWYLRQYSEIAGKLKELLKDTTRFADFEQAQVLLGYLADFPKQRKDSDSEQTDNYEELDNA